MVLYDYLAPFYDPVLQPLYRPFRQRALEKLPELAGETVLDLACGTGQNFPTLMRRIGPGGRLIGVDLSSGMLQRADRWRKKKSHNNIKLLHLKATELENLPLQAEHVLCTYGFTAMREWESAFRVSWNLLRPGGTYLIHDIYAEQPTFHSRTVEKVTNSDFSRRSWELLQGVGNDFRMEFIDPSTWLFGGRLFVATGVKP